MERVRELYEQGRSIQEIASELGIPKTRVYYYLGRLGVEVRMRRARVTTVRDTAWGKVLTVSPSLLRELDVPAGSKWRWEFRDGKIIGERVE